MSDKNKNKQTLVGMGAPSAEEIAADAAEKAAAATDAVEAPEAVEAAAESKGSDSEAPKDPKADDAKAKKSDDDTRAETSSAKKKKRESEAPAAAAKDDSRNAKADETANDKADEAPAASEGLSDDEDNAETRRPALYLAQYETPDELHKAACLVRDEGFEHWDCHTPYPMHGMDDAMGLPPTKIGIISFIHAVIGLATAVLMIQYMNNWDYPIIVGGKPAGAFAPMVPIMFELTVLLTGFGTLFGLLHLAGLPRHHHPIFESDRFVSATDDKFFISIEVKDPNFDLKKTRELLEGTNPSHLELVEEDLV
ncbi:MAG: hypothetical protein ACI9KE_003964 [Polyangiales bacterium]|jgi:hypothetical protein